MEKHEQLDFFPEDAAVAGVEKQKRKHLRETRGINPAEILRRQTVEQRKKLVDGEKAAIRHILEDRKDSPKKREKSQ